MTSRDFCYWLQVYFEIRNKTECVGQSLTGEQVQCIKAHLALVFLHEIDPDHAKTVPSDVAQAVHDVNPQVRC